MLEFFQKLFDTSDFPARWHCGNWTSGLGWLHIISDLLVFGAYFAIPLSLTVYVKMKAQEVAFPKLYLLFAIFITSCGFTHLIDATIFWHPWYRLSGVMKAITGVVSWATVIMLIKVMPKAMALPGVVKLNVELCHEIEERKKTEMALRDTSAQISQAMQQAEAANRMKDDFLSTLSHELRTPLNAILSWCQVLREDRTSASELKMGLEIIERNSRAQVQLIEDLLDMSRIVSGKVRMDMQSVNLAQVVKAAVESVTPMAAARMIKINTVLDPMASPLQGDPTRLQQVVWNLLTNAIKFTAEGGRVSLVLQRMDSHVQISVSDTGIGIAPEVLLQVFDKFHQADTSMGRRHGGLGLGLSIAKHLVELHGGQIIAKSPGLGQGATFQVQIPLPVSHGSDEPGSRGHSHGPNHSAVDATNLSGIRILAVDDEPDSLEALRRILENRKASVTVCHSGEAVLQKLQEQSFDVLVSDIGMPGMDGMTLIRHVRDLTHPMRQIPAVALTAFARPEDRRRALTAGFDCYLSKPVDTVELRGIIAHLASHSVASTSAVLA